MKIWSIRHKLSEGIALIDYKNFDINAPHIFFQGERLGATWKEPAAHLNPAQPRASVVDFPFFEHGALLCSINAWNILQPYLQEEVELLPVDVEGYNYVLLNPIRVIDCLDRQQSKFTIYKTGRVIEVQHYVFQQEKLNGAYLFKTPELKRTDIYATEALREAVEHHKLIGLDFRNLP